MKPSHRLLVSAALLVGILLAMQLRFSGDAVPIRKPLDGFPLTLGPWQGRQGVMLETDELNALKLKDYVVRRYMDASGQYLWLYIGYWDSQRKGAQIHSPRNCLPGAGWEPLEASTMTIDLPAPYGSIAVNRFLIQKDQDQQVAFYWYQSQGRATAGEVAARLQLVKNSLFRNRTDGALVRITAPTRGSASETSRRLIGYIRAMYPVLHEYLPD